MTTGKLNWTSVLPPFPLPDSFPLAFHVTDMEGTICRVSDTWLDTLGYERRDVIGRKNIDFLTCDSATIAHGAMSKFFDRGHTPAQQRDFVKQNGEILACELSASVLMSDDGEALGAVAIVNPLCGATSLVDGLRRKSNRLQSCLEGTNAGTWEWNVQTGETIFNERWAEIVGFTLDELRPCSIDTWLSLAHPEDLEISAQRLQQHWDGETKFYDMDARMRHKDGHWVWVRDRGRVFSWTEDGRLEWMFGTHFSLDDEQRQRAENALMQRLLDRTGSVAGVGGWQVDLDTKEVLWTAQTRRIHGVDDDYVPTVETGIQFYAPEARDTITTAIGKAIEDGTPWDLELPFIRATGERIWARAVGEVEFDEGRPRRLLGAFQDITDRKEQNRKLEIAVAALERSNKELDGFAYVASHDLKAPLRVIANATRWLEEDLEEHLDEESRISMDMIRSRVRRMEKMLDDLLAHARVGHLTKTGGAISGSKLMEDVIDLAAVPQGFEVVMEGDWQSLTIDRFPIQTVLLNLVSNAIRHHDRKTGTVTVSISTKDGAHNFTVEDDGPGIPEEYCDKVFDMFQTLRSRDVVEGSGMGLAIVKKTVELSGGSISLKPAEDRGSIFSVHWPSANIGGDAENCSC